MQLAKYSIGIGDRFGHQGGAQLAALQQAQTRGINITPVWNKSFREHEIIGTKPADTRRAADAAVRQKNWQQAYFLDADHISPKNVDLFLEACDFFTLDVAEAIGQAPQPEDLQIFIKTQSGRLGQIQAPGLDQQLTATKNDIEHIGQKYLAAIKEAGRLYRHIAAAKGQNKFITEVSMDECLEPQSPLELFFILAALADEGVPANTIAPKFTGRFNKGVDYAGDAAQFTREFEMDLAVIRFAAQEFDLPKDIKISIHSGSDKFSLYAPIRRALAKFNAGVHLKTAGTTWLEEAIGLCMAGGTGLEIVREIHAKSLARFDELCKPYATVIDIDRSKLPTVAAVRGFSGDELAEMLRHDEKAPRYNPHFRQLLHVAYKVAAEMGPRYLEALEQNESFIAPNVTENLFQRHIVPVFM